MDLPFAHIACCIDDSEEAALALAEARRLRALSPGRLTIVHVAPEPLLYAEPLLIDPRELRAAAERWLRAQVDASPGAEGTLLTGLPQRAVLDWADEAGPDLLIAAPRHTLRERIVLGSFTNHLLHRARHPVLLVRPTEAGSAPPADSPYRHIVCCVEPTPASAEALELARRVRAAGTGRLTALTVAHFPPPSELYPALTSYLTPEQVAHAAGTWLRHRTEGMEDVEAVIEQGYPPVAATAWARDHGCDLMVAAAHRGLVARLRLGSFAGFLAHQAPCSVLLTRPSTEHQGGEG